MEDSTSLALDDIRALSVADAEKAMLSEEQVECPVVHRFGPGIYIREVHIPAGTVAIGHRHKHSHMNVMLQGRITLLTDDGPVELQAPLVYVSEPGRKVAYVHEDLVWQNIYATEETDIETLEAALLDKSEHWLATEGARMALEGLSREPDRQDYLALLDERGIEPETAREIAESDGDMDWATTASTVMLADSPIEGKGLFATYPIADGDVIAPARIDGKRTIAGRYTNHAKEPNARMVGLPNGDIVLVASRDIAGCRGGQPGEEITIDYRQALDLVEEIALCQQ